MSTHRRSHMIQARALMGFEPILADHGLSYAEHLQAAGISLAAMSDPDLPIALDSLALLYSQVAQALGWADFGLRIVQYQDTRMYGPLGQIILNASTVGAALQGLIQYFAYHTSGAMISLAQAPDSRFFELRYQLQLSPQVPSRYITEQSYTMACKLWRMLVRIDSPAPRILLRHTPLLPVAHYQEQLGCPVAFEQTVDAIWLPVEEFSQPIDQADPLLRQASEAYVAGVLRRFPMDLAKQVETLLQEQLATGNARLETVAEQLGLHKRTLQRRLSERGIVFAELLDELRRNLAQHYLSDAHLPLQSLSALLGYNEQSSFIRACKRWFGQTPQQLRSSATAAKP